MIKVKSLEQIQQAIKQIRDFKKGYLTNLFFDPEKFELWINKEILYSSIYNETILLFKKNNSFFNVYYCTTTIEKLYDVLDILKNQASDNILVFDVIRPRTSTDTIPLILEKNGFFPYTTLTRMSRLIETNHDMIDNESIRHAKKNDLSEIQFLLNRYFDEYAEQLPLDEELIDWIEKEHLILYVENERIIGFIIFDINGRTSYLRYWFVHPLHRNKKVGSSLLQWFFYESRNSKRQLFWVIEDNENAIMRYKHYGFTNENLVDKIYININKKYEDRSN